MDFPSHWLYLPMMVLPFFVRDVSIGDLMNVVEMTDSPTMPQWGESAKTGNPEWS